MDTIIEEYINLAFISTHFHDLKTNYQQNRFSLEDEKLTRKTKSMLGIKEIGQNKTGSLRNKIS